MVNADNLQLGYSNCISCVESSCSGVCVQFLSSYLPFSKTKTAGTRDNFIKAHRLPALKSCFSYNPRSIHRRETKMAHSTVAAISKHRLPLSPKTRINERPYQRPSHHCFRSHLANHCQSLVDCRYRWILPRPPEQVLNWSSS